MSAHAFLDQLESQRLLDDAIISDLRRQVDGSTRAINAETIAKLLVDNGHLTKFQATKLVSDLGDADATDSTAKSSTGSGGKSKRRRGKPKQATPPPVDDDDELGLVDDDDDGGLEPLDDDDGGLEPLDDEGGLQPLGGGGGGLQPLDGGGGLQPLSPATSPAGGLQPLGGGAGGGLQPLDGGGGLQPLGGGLQPLDGGGGGGLQPLDAGGGGGLQPLGGGGLEPLGGGGGLQPLGGGGQESHGGGGLAPMGAGGDSIGGEEDEPPKRAKGPKKKVNRENIWDSPLLLVGGAGLLLLLIAGVWLTFSLSRGTAQEIFDNAEKEYRAGSYTASITVYEKFLKSYPKDPNASMAKVRIGMARVRTAIENASDPQKGLDVSLEHLPVISQEESFGEARPELSTLLPALAMNFAERADRSKSIEDAEQQLAKVNETMDKLVNNPTYISTATRKSIASTLEAITELQDKVGREIGRNKALRDTVAIINKKTASGDTMAAYDARKALIQTYPGLSTHEQLVSAVDGITAAARSLVQNQPLGREPITDEPPSTVRRVMLAGNGGERLAGGDSQLALAYFDGAVYGVNAGTGRAQWRRFVGYDAPILPVMISEDPESDALVADVANHELMRVKAADGAIVWRMPLGEPFNQPVVTADETRVILSTRSGLVVELDIGTGTPSQAAKIPQTLAVGPGRGDTQRPTIYQLADHDNLYVLNTEDLKCRQVYHLGHRDGAIVVPPVMAVGHIFVAENMGPDRSRLHVLAGGEDGMQLVEAQPPISLDGRITSPLMVAGRQLVVVTDLGAISILGIAPQKEDQPPVTPAVKPRVATYTEPTSTYSLFANSRMWIADKRLLHYEVHVAKGDFVQKEVGNEGAAFVGPLQHVGKGLIHVRRPPGSPGVTMRAVDDRSIDDTLWFTELGVPAASVMIEGSRIFVISGRGRLYPVDAESVTNGFATPTDPPEPSDVNNFFSHAVRLPSGIHVAVSQSGQVVAVDPMGRQQRRKLQGARGAIVTPLTPMGDGFLAGLDSGQVVHADAIGRAIAQPFQPELEVGGRVQWRRPAVLSNEEFVIANDRRMLFRVKVNDRDQKHLAQVSKAVVRDEIVSSLAFMDGKVWGVLRSQAGDKLTAFDLEELKPGEAVELDGRVTSGPDVIGDDMLLTTTGKGLVCYGADGSEKWNVPISSAVVGTPVVANGGYLVGLAEGKVLVVDVSSGKVTASKDLGEPIRTQVLPFGPRIMTTGIDGTLLFTTLDTPTAPPQAPEAEATASR